MSKADKKELQRLIQSQFVRMQEILDLKTNLFSKANPSTPMLKSYMRKLDQEWDNCRRDHAAIQNLKTSEDETHMYFNKQYYTVTKEAYRNASDFILETLPDSTDQLQSTTLNTSIVSKSTNVKLPSIELPSFNGKYTEWINFRELFSTLVIRNEDLSDVEKLHYLKSCLVDEASSIVTNIALSENNFCSTWNLIKERYDNSRSLINAYLKIFYEFPVITSEFISNLKLLRDTSNSVRTALQNLNIDIESGDYHMIYTIVTKLDKQSRREWEMQISNTTEFPKYSEIERFISSRIRALESISTTKSVETKPNQSSSKYSKNNSVNSHQTSLYSKCPFCDKDHKIYTCNSFKDLTVADRQSFIRNNARCINCLAKNHKVDACPSKFVCKLCGRKHHNLLHKEQSDISVIKNLAEQSAIKIDRATPMITNSVNTHFNNNINCSLSPVLLATARVQLIANGRKIQVRALLDQGSEVSFINENIVQLLRLPRSRISTSISSIGGQRTGNVSYSIDCSLKAIDTLDNPIPFRALVIPKITNYVPKQFDFIHNLEHLKNLKLADPSPSSTDPIDLLIGADLYALLIRDGLRVGLPGTPVAQLTIFGWMISGPLSQSSSHTHTVNVHHAFDNSLNESLKKFWEIEEISQMTFLTQSEQECDLHFQNTHYRNDQGRYCVKLPFLDSSKKLGQSKDIAQKFFFRLEKKLLGDQTLQKLYSDFMSEYENLGHMSRIDDSKLDEIERYFIPHHPVIRDSSCTTKLRVVFNASCPTSNGVSLNDILHIGPKLQADLPSLILRWRLHKYVMCTDIAKMFRQIQISPEDRRFQCILWRNSPNENLKAYELNTVTYGTACAPYIANRVIQQLAIDGQIKFPLAASVLKSDIYVDDVFFGANDLNHIRDIRNEITELTQSAEFKLRKWCSNSPELLSDLNPSDHGLAIEIPFEENQGLKVLGVLWNPKEDNFKFQMSDILSQTINKRHILSVIAKLFDPLGWIAPVIIRAKILLQSLWLLKISWDEVLPEVVQQKWVDFRDSIHSLSNISIPRWIYQDPNVSNVELHGFSDASSSAYAAVIYARIITESGEIHVSLLTAKTKVAPIKTLSIPRLELCAASLLTKLMKVTSQSLKLPNVTLYCWTDSKIVLSWLQKTPATWTVFVANRVSDIQTRLPDAIWNHVPTKDNPADCASRGLSPSELPNYSLWWNGPAWLLKSQENWPVPVKVLDSTAIEKRSKLTTHLVEKEDEFYFKFSSWARLLRVTAYIFKFINRLRNKGAFSRFISATDVNLAAQFWIRYMQESEFSTEIACLSRKEELPKRSKLYSLDPYLDPSNILRVGGRIRNSTLHDSRLCPAILPRHYLSSLIVRQMHQNLLHAGTQLTLGVIRERYWILGSRSLVKTIIRNCVTCTRFKAQTNIQFMADLPSPRCSPSRAFTHTGVDYAGPFDIRESSGRGRKSHKSYIVVFVCFSTRAIHLELVNDYSSTAFLAAFRRFVSRRGIPSDIYSDNGTTFRGCDKELSKTFHTVSHDPELRSIFASDNTTWHFIPPSAPHFGGLWEAGVKSVKTHLRKIIGSATLTYEEFITLLTQIECCLNSRPIAPLKDDSDCYNVLTPGHFLIGTSLKSVPVPSVIDLSENRLSRWQFVQKTFERFWRLWVRDYLTSLQQRNKWSSRKPNLKIGELVLIKNDNLPPTKWELGRIISCKPGNDNLVRVVTVKTANSQYVRPVTKICKLPVAIDEEAKNV